MFIPLLLGIQDTVSILDPVCVSLVYANHSLIVSINHIRPQESFSLRCQGPLDAPHVCISWCPCKMSMVDLCTQNIFMHADGWSLNFFTQSFNGYAYAQKIKYHMHAKAISVFSGICVCMRAFPEYMQHIDDWLCTQKMDMHAARAESAKCTVFWFFFDCFDFHFTDQQIYACEIFPCINKIVSVFMYSARTNTLKTRLRVHKRPKYGCARV